MVGLGRAGVERWMAWAAAALFLPLLAATAATVWILTEIRKEQRAVAELLRRDAVLNRELLGTLPGELRWQLVLTVLVLLVLVAAAVALWSMMRAYGGSQRMLREERLLSAEILASMEQGVITTDHATRITTANPRAASMLEWTGDAQGSSLETLGELEVRLAAGCREVLTRFEPIHDLDLTVDRRDARLQLRADLHLLRDDRGDVKGTVVHLRDVTDRVLMEERLRRMERFMGLGSLVAGLHHEIKNPLGALSLHVQLLEESLEERGDRELVENLGVVKTEVARILMVLETFRDFAAMDRLHRTETDVPRIVQQTVELLRPQAARQRVQIETRLPPTPWPLVSADASRLQQVFVNLAMNALEAMPDGGRLVLTVEYHEGAVWVDVADTGPGIPETVRSRIFDPYFTTKKNGSGMGLAVSDKIVRQHGGQIDLQTGSQGTTFRVVLPTESE